MPVADRHTSTAYSAQRYAHPFFVTTPPAARQPFNGHLRMTDWSKLQLGPVYSTAGDQTMKLADIIGKQGSDEIQSLGEIRFHAVGDTGVNHAEQAENVADEMSTDYQAGAGGLNPAFLFHLGDVVYGPDKENHYGERFYRPYRHYPGKILGIPGNHDGEAKSKADEPSLSAFRDHFCAKKAGIPIQASGSGIFRENMTQPGVYWLLDAPFMRMIGLYSNRLENPGYLEGRDSKGKVDKSQITWLQDTLNSIAKNPAKKALVIATHHPPYSQGGHSGSTEMSATIDAACTAAGVTPDLFLSGHAHNYQRYTRRINQKQVPYIVAGTGGISPQKVANASGQVVDPVNHVTFDASHESYGYLLLSVSKIAIKIAFWVLDPPDQKAFETITVDLTTGTVS
jgi:Calcineurin-like phosphoesterase